LRCRPQITLWKEDWVLKHYDAVDEECAHDHLITMTANYEALPQYKNCVFFARKFRHQTSELVHKLLTDLYII
jgi:hypothetical protein